MLKVGDTITVKYSRELARARHSDLQGSVGTVTKVVRSSGRMTGVQASIRVGSRMRNYFIPTASIEGDGDVDRMRNIQILKSVNL